MEIVVATFNSHKIEELVPMFPGHRLLSPRDIGIADFEIAEDGESYVANALIKAKAFKDHTDLPILADDSGLSVAALGGAPGIHSSRYGALDGALLTAETKNALLLRNMEAETDRRCAFYCCLILMHEDDSFIAVQETCPGTLLASPRGSGGFGYDPVVYLPELGKSVAELTREEKALVSHRGKAARLLRKSMEAALPS